MNVEEEEFMKLSDIINEQEAAEYLQIMIQSGLAKLVVQQLLDAKQLADWIINNSEIRSESVEASQLAVDLNDPRPIWEQNK